MGLMPALPRSRRLTKHTIDYNYNFLHTDGRSRRWRTSPVWQSTGLAGRHSWRLLLAATCCEHRR
jgi:hypothetical protein